MKNDEYDRFHWPNYMWLAVALTCGIIWSWRKLVVSVIISFLIFSYAYADMTVTFVDVGQGDAEILQIDGYNILIDAGPKSASNALHREIQKCGILKFDLLITTHPHEDHIGGMSSIIDTYPFDNIWMPRVGTSTQVFEKLLLKIQETGHTIHAPSPGEIIDAGDAIITVLAPNRTEYEQLNDYSIVIRVDYGEISFLFTGDAEYISELEMIVAGYDLDVDILKVGHHGSNSSSSEWFLEAITPEYAIISCGEGNEYGHPDSDVMERLSMAAVYRTDLLGTIKIKTDGYTVQIITERSAP